MFVDESGQPDERAFAVGGVVVEAAGWGVLRDRWQAALARHGWPHDKEVKWHGTRTGEVPPAVADAVFEALVGAPMTCLAGDWAPRTPLVLSVSRDEGASWTRLVTLEAEGVPDDFGGLTAADTGIAIDARAEFSYPTAIPFGEGVAVAYTWKRRQIALAFVAVPTTGAGAM